MDYRYLLLNNILLNYIELEKVCNKCNELKSLELFTKSKTGKDGYRNCCKMCTNLNKNKEHSNNYNKNYYINNKESILKYKTEEYNKKPETKTRLKNWYNENKDSINKKKREYKKTIPHIISWRNMLSHSLARLGQIKEGKTIDMLGYSALELKAYISSLFTEGMSWDNYGEWHIDHIIPVSSFDKDTPMNVVNALSNLQPLWATTKEINGVIYDGNLNKRNKIISN